MELVIAFDDRDDVIETLFDQAGTAWLEQRAGEVQDVLAAKGWVALTP